MEEEARVIAEGYIVKLEEALSKMSMDGKSFVVTTDAVASLMDAVKRYLSDAKYYLEEGGVVTALASVSYAEGLLDSLGALGVASVDWGRRR